MPSLSDSVSMTSSEQSSSVGDRRDKICKAAFLMVKGSIAEDLGSRDQFVEALQYAGFNPTKKSVSKYWAETTRQLTFSQFCTIVEEEPLPTESSLVASFQKLDDNNTGYITHDEFLLNMTTRGEMLPQGIIERLISDQKYNQDKKFFYRKFCQAVIETSDRLGTMAFEKLQQEEEEFMVNSKTYKVKRKTNSPEKTQNGSHTECRESPKYLQKQTFSNEIENKWKCQMRSKGSFFFEKESIISHQYQIDVTIPTFCRISVQAEKQYRSNSPLVDVQLYLFDESKRFLGRTTGKGSQSSPCQWEGHLAPGKFLLVPHTSGARLKKRQTTPSEETQLIVRFPKIKLTREFQQLLSDIYDKVDLDGNGTLSRKEFNLFNWRTSGEEVADEEWSVVEENFPLKDGELTLDGFLTLHQMEAEDNEGDPSELKVTVQSMGYDRRLVQDESASFSVNLAAEEETSCLLSVCGLKSAGLLLEKTVTRCAIEADTLPVKVKGTKNILVYKETTGERVTYVYQNKSENSVNIQMDLSKSRGIVHNGDGSVFKVSVPKKSSLIAAHILPEREGKPWTVESSSKVLR